MMHLVLLQILAHVFADFIFQTAKMSRIKCYKILSLALLVHVIIVFALSWMLSMSLDFVLYALIIACSHFFIDLAKSWFSRRWHRDMFFVDQLMHLAIIVLVVYMYGSEFNPLFDISTHKIAITLAFVFVTKPTNILIREILRVAKIDIPKGGEKDSQGVINAGRLIGIIERLLTLVFVLLGAYQTIGFIIAAKSILRFKDTDRVSSEYVLIGTLLSFGIAVLVGVGIPLITAMAVKCV